MARRTTHRITLPREASEPTLPLINIVFLMLIFFLVAAQLARPLDPDLRLVDTADPSVTPPPDALVILADGSTRFRGAAMTPEAAFAVVRAEGLGRVARIVPDRTAPARRVIEVADALRALGADRVVLITEHALP